MATVAVGVAGGVATNLVTELIKSLVLITRTAVRCQEECRKLEEVLKFIQPEVEHVELQLQELQFYNLSLKPVEDRLERLKAALHLASIEVHKSNTASRIGQIIGSYPLSKKITTQNTKITELARDLATTSAELENRLEAERSKYPSRKFQKWNEEKNSIVHRAEFTRLSERYSEGAAHGVYGSSSGSPGQHSPHHLNHSTSDPSQTFHHSPHHMHHPDPHQFHRSNTAPY